MILRIFGLVGNQFILGTFLKMTNLSVFIERASSFEKELDEQLQRVQTHLGLIEWEALIRQVEAERSKRLGELLGNLREEAFLDSETAGIIVTENISSFEESLESLKEAEQHISQEKQEELVSKAGVPLLEFNVELVENLSKEIHLSNSDQPIEGLRELRNKAERMWRLTLLTVPSSQHEFETTLRWMAGKGGEEELNLIRNVKSDLLYSSDDVKRLLDITEKKIEYRVEKSRYKVFCSQNELERRFPGILIIESYRAFSVVLVSAETITTIQRFFPVECLRPKPLLGEQDVPYSRDQIVRFNTPVSESRKQRIEETGSKILQPLGRLEIVVSVPHQDTVDQIRSLEGVAQVTPYTPKIRIQPQYLQNLGQDVTKELIAAARLEAARSSLGSQSQITSLPGILIAIFFTTEDCDCAVQNLESRSIQIADRPSKTKLVLDISSDNDAMESLKTITEQPGLQSLEEKTIPKLLNDQACLLVGESVIPSNPSPSLSLTGKGEIIAIADTGLDTGEAETLHLDFHGRVHRISSYPIPPSLNSYVLNPGDDDGASDIYSGHGTHVAGSALGNGEQAKELSLSCKPAGMAPEAILIFQAVEQTIKWNLDGQHLWWKKYHINPPPSGLFGIPDDLGKLFEEAYIHGARIHSNSWGGGVPGVYDSRCEDLDQFVWDHRDFLVLVAAGNSGKHTSSGIPAVDPGSVNSPGTAKNCLTVGASENNRAKQFPDTYGKWWPNDFPYEPFNSDGIVDSVNDVAAFSSRGPCEDGRCKPDVIAPGTFILSTRSSQIPSNNFAWGVHPPARWHYMYMGGTSMATPLVAGCAALVRQYLRENQVISNPSAALIKAALIHSAEYIEYRFPHPSCQRWADNEQGWGRINLRQALNPAEFTQVIFIDEATGLKTGEKREYTLEIAHNSVPLKATLVYTDYPGESLINNLNLILYSPSDKYYLGNDFTNIGKLDTINNVEGVVVESPEIGVWRIEVVAEVQQDQQDFALVISGGGLSRV